LAKITVAVLELIDKIERSHSSRIWPITGESIKLSKSAIGNLEVMVGVRSQLKSLAWLHEGLDRARFVCRVVSPAGVGTGFLINPGVLVTNNHVVRTPSDAAHTVLEFNYEEDIAGNLRDVVRYRLDPEHFFTSVELDCTAVNVRPASCGESLERWGKLSAETEKPVTLQDHVTIIQHPLGGIKQICVTDNRVINVFGNFIQYTTDTASGSSGSPVFNDRWRVVAIHHKGGDLVKNGRGDHVFANQGVLMSAIIAQNGFSKLLGKVPKMP
jgi:endonuclease G